MINPKKYAIDNDHLFIGEEKVEFANSAKNLGVIIDENLNMNCHVTNISRAINLEIRKLKHMSKNFGLFLKHHFQKVGCHITVCWFLVLVPFYQIAM